MKATLAQLGGSIDELSDQIQTLNAQVETLKNEAQERSRMLEQTADTNLASTSTYSVCCDLVDEVAFNPLQSPHPHPPSHGTRTVGAAGGLGAVGGLLIAVKLVRASRVPRHTHSSRPASVALCFLRVSRQSYDSIPGVRLAANTLVGSVSTTQAWVYTACDLVEEYTRTPVMLLGKSCAHAFSPVFCRWRVRGAWGPLKACRCNCAPRADLVRFRSLTVAMLRAC